MTADRDAASPIWRPVLDGGQRVRWYGAQGDFDGLPSEWLRPRVVYLQHATDPITWLSPRLLWERPAWLGAERSDQVSASMHRFPLVTAIQVTVDMLLGESVPAGYGHNFGDGSLAGWLAVLDEVPVDADGLQAASDVLQGYASEDEDDSLG